MCRNVLVQGVLLFLLLAAPAARSQPFDLILPNQETEETLSTELRRMQSIERDISLEKLTDPRTKLEALIELGDLRASHGKLEEAQRFYEMALEMQPDNLLANKGLAMVLYHEGKFGKTKDIYERLAHLYPMSDTLQEDVEKVRSKLKTLGEAGLRIREDNRGFQQVVGSVEAYFPSFTYPKLSARYRYEDWTFDEANVETHSRVLSGTLEYILNHRSRMALTYAPESFAGRRDVNGFTIQGVTGSPNLHLAAMTGRTPLKENLATVQSGLWEDYGSLVLFGDLSERARVIQTINAADLSDGNARRRFETEVLYFIHRRGIPFVSLDLKISSNSFERQYDAAGIPFVYWAPSDFRTAQLTCSWERSVGANWWYGFDTTYFSHTYRDYSPFTQLVSGFGLTLHASYRFPTGRLHAEYGNTMQNYYRERRLGIFGSYEF